MTSSGRFKGRGAACNPANRFEPLQRVAEPVDDEPPAHALATEVQAEHCRTLISSNDSPDIPFRDSVNPYRGCEHGCVYCYARPSHAYLGWSPGLDFETRLVAKVNAVKALRRELAHPGYRCTPLALGSNTDPYQPVESRFRLTRGILELLLDCRHPVVVVTKSARIESDLDLLSILARENLAAVYLSITTLDNRLAARLEPRASAPHRRLQTLRRLSEAGIPCGVLVAPVIPALTDHELERIVEAAAVAGARSASYQVLRLPLEVKELFDEWLSEHVPDRRRHVLSLIRQLRDGRLNDARFHSRHRGEGPLAELYAQRMALSRKRHGLVGRSIQLDTRQFRPPELAGQQRLF
jgi:DNA repair photolyase